MRRLLTICLTLLYYVTHVSAQSDSVAHVTHFSEAEGYAQSIVSYAIQDRKGYVWLGTWNGLVRYDGYRFQTFKARPGDGSPLRTNRISTVRELENGQLECTTTDSMTCLFHPQSGRFEQVDGDYSHRPRPYKADAATESKVRSVDMFRDTYVRILIVDRQGGIWVDTHSGLYRIWFTRSPLHPVMTTTGSEQAVRALHIDRLGRTWVADKNGYVRIGQEYLTAQGTLSQTAVPFGWSIYCILEDSRGDVWMGCKPGGLIRLTPLPQGGGYRVSRYAHSNNDPYSLSSDNIYAIAEDMNQRLWIATYKGGLNMLDLRSERDVFIHSGNGLTGWPEDEEAAKMHCLYITPDQVLVAGTLGGLFTAQLKDKPQQIHFNRHLRRANDATSLTCNWVMDLQPLPDGMLAIATNGGGICLTQRSGLKNGKELVFRPLMADQGLASDICQSMLYTPADSSLYIVSQAAISRLSLADSTITNYLRGRLADHFNLLETKPARTPDGHLLFGTTSGVLNVSPDDMARNSYRPVIVFECPNELNLSPEERTYTIRFAALDYNKNVPITYAYLIEGMTDQWIYTTDNSITLPDIPAGTWKMRLRSTNGDGVWVDNESLLTIHRRAAFRETTWFQMLSGLLLAVLLFVAWRVFRYIRQLQKDLKDVRLTSNQRIELLGDQLREALSIKESVHKVNEMASPDNEEDRLFMERVKACVMDNISNSDLIVGDIARELCISRSVFFLRVRQTFGVSPNNMVMNMRIDHALQLLKRKSITVAEVAYQCGFSDPKYFTKCFKKLVGKTPSEYQGKTS